MDAVTVSKTEYHEIQVLHSDAEFGGLDELLVADRSTSGMGREHDRVVLSLMRMDNETKTIYIPASAMDNLCELWQGEKESSTIADLRASHDAQTAEIHNLRQSFNDMRADRDSAKAYIDGLHDVLSTKDQMVIDRDHRVSELETSLAQAIALQGKAEQERERLQKQLDVARGGTRFYINEMDKVDKELSLARDSLKMQGESLEAEHAERKRLEAERDQLSAHIKPLMQVAEASKVAYLAFVGDGEICDSELSPLESALESLDEYQKQATRAMLNDRVEDMSTDEDTPNPDEDINDYEAAKEEIRTAIASATED